MLVIPRHHLLVRQVPYHKFSFKCLCTQEKTKMKKVKAIRRELYVAFISKNIILKESLTLREGKTVTSIGRYGSEWEICNERVNKVEERKERKKEGTYVKRAMWWRDKISYERLLHLSSKSTVVLRLVPRPNLAELICPELCNYISLKATKDETATN